MEPIEIELRMKQNLEAESKKAQKGIDGLSESADKSRAKVRENIAIQKKVISELRKELKPLQDEFKKVNHATHDPKILAERKKLSAVIKEMTAELNGEEQALSKMEKGLAGTETKMVSLRSQMRTVRDEMGAMRLNNQANTEEYKKLEAQLGKLGTAYREMMYVQQSVSTAGTNLGGFMDGLNVLTGAFSASTGALALFNNDSEKMAKIQTQLQKVMAISIGLMQVSNALHSTSAFRITTVTKVTQFWSATNLRLATTLGISTAAANALMATLTLGLSVAITAAITLISRFVSKQREAAKEAREFNLAVADGASEQIDAYNKLRIAYKALGEDTEAQTKFLKEQKEEFDNLKKSVDDLNEAERFFSDEGAEAFKRGIIERAKSVAIMELATEKFKEIIEKDLSIDDGSAAQITFGQKLLAYVGSSGNLLFAEQMKLSFAKKNLEKAKEEVEVGMDEYIDTILKSLAHKKDADKIFEELGMMPDNTIVEDTRAYWASQKKAAEDRLDAMKASEAGSKEWQKHIEDIKKAEEKLKIWSWNSTGSPTVDDEKERENLARKYKEIEDAAQKARIAAMEDGIEKTLAENELGHKERLEAIDRQKSELLKAMQELEEATWLSQGGKGEFKPTITELPKELNEKFIAQTEASISQLQRANDEAINKLISSFATDNKDTSAIIGSIVTVQKEKLDQVATYERLQLKALANEEQKLDVETYNKRKLLIKKSAENARDAIAQEAEEALKLIPKDMLNELFGEFDLSFMNLNAATLGQLNKVADKLQKLKLDKSELITLGLSESQIDSLQSLLSEMKSEGASNIQTAKLQKMQQVFSEVGSVMANAGDEMTRAIGQMVTGIGQMVTTLNDPNASGLQKASGIVSLAIAGGNELAKIRREWETKEVDKQIEHNKALSSQLTIETEINRIRRERAEIDRNSSAFLKPYFKDEYRAQLDTLKDADKAMNDSLGALMGNAVFSADGKGKRRIAGTKKGNYSFSMEQLLGDYAVAYGGDGASDLLPLLFGGVGGLAGKAFNKGGSFSDIAGALLDPAGLFGGYADRNAQSDALGKLRTAFDTTFKAMGKTSADIANMSSQEWVDFFTLMDEGGYVTDEGTKKLIENAKQAAEDYQEAMQKMRDIIADVAGSLGTQIASDLVAAFKAGEDAAEAFKKSVNQVLQQMFMQQIQTSFFQSHFDKLQKDMEKSMDGGDGNWEDDLMRFFNDIEPSIGKAQKAMEVWDKKMAEAGYDGFSGGDEDSRTAQKKGLAQASQESIDELQGRVMAISGNVYKIYEGNLQLINIERESLLINRTITAQLDVIADNTSYCKYLVDIDNTLEEIKTRGVKVR